MTSYLFRAERTTKYKIGDQAPQGRAALSLDLSFRAKSRMERAGRARWAVAQPG